MERRGYLGITLKDQPQFYEPEEINNFYMRSPGQQRVSIVTQNVDSLHQRAGSKDVLQLHGAGYMVKCMNCGKKRHRSDFTAELERLNEEWVLEARKGYEKSSDVRPDGDALLKQVDYTHVHVPNCEHCKTGFFKTDVVFFGDAVPKNRVALCEEAVKNADGVLVIGSSLAVHSAFRHVQAAHRRGIPIAILNVGETRAEAEKLDNLLKIEAPIGDTLTMCTNFLS